MQEFLVFLTTILIVPSTATITFTNVPKDLLIAVGSQARFVCQFSSSNAASVQWKKDGETVLPSSRIIITTMSLTINSTQAGDDGEYSCVVTDQVSQVSETRNATLTFAYILDSFLINPDTKTVKAGTTTSLFCLHSGSLPEANITWVKDSNTLSNTGTITITTAVLQHANPPQTSSSISFNTVSVSDSGNYECVATNSLIPSSPVKSNIAILTVQVQPAVPTILMHPSSLVLISSGLPVILRCSASGEPLPAFTWQKNGVNINASFINILITNSGGNSTMTIANFQQSDVGDYRCAATNSEGTAYSNNATVELAFIAESFQLPPQDTFALFGERGILNCVPPLSAPSPVVSWFHDGMLISGDQFSIASNGSLLISSVNYNNEGNYVCTALNQLLQINRTSPSAHFSVYEIPTIVSHSQNVQIAQYNNLTLSCNGTGVPSPNITWYKDGVIVTSSNQLINGLVIYNVSVDNEGLYLCVVSNIAGSDQADIIVDVIPFPVALIDHIIVNVEVLYPVLLPCNIQPDESINITWFFNGDKLILPFPGFQLLQNGSLYIQLIAKSQEGTYTCTGTNALATVSVTVKLDVQVAPTVTAVQNSLTYTQGQIAQLQCNVTGDPFPVILWYKDGVTVPNSMSTNTELSQNNTLLTFSPLLKTHEGVYTCIATNILGSDNDTISLNVLVAPSISASPLTQIVLIDTTVEYTCTATGDPEPTLNWLTSNLVNVLLLDDSRFQMLPDNKLRITNVTHDDMGQYICQAINSVGEATVTVSLTVQELPSVTLIPFLNATQGAHVTLDCQPTGAPVPTITWYKDGVTLIANNHINIINNTIVIESTLATDTGLYQCVANNSLGNDSASINLYVLSIPLILIPNPIVSVNEGSDAHLICVARGDPTPTLTWYSGSVPLPHPTLSRYSVDKNGTLIISNINSGDEGSKFTCQASNAAGSESATLTIEVNIPPNVTAIASSITAVEGNSAFLTCAVTTGDPFPTITWYTNNSAVTHNATGFQYASNGQTLIIGSVKIIDEGLYTCEAVNVAGIAEDTIDLVVQVPPRFSIPLTDSGGIENNVYILTCSANGDPTPFVQWSQGGVIFPTGNNLTFSPLLKANAGLYTCTATNVAGSISETIYLDVYYTPEIVLDPSNASSIQHTNVSFTCNATGNPVPQYHWLYNGIKIPGAMESTYIIPSVSSSDGGQYSCVANNVAGMALSNPATLTILFPPSAPTITLVTAISATSLSVTWSPPTDDGGAPISSYIIEYQPTSDTVYMNLTVEEGRLTTHIIGLSPYTKYDIKISAVNIAGIGNSSDIYSPAVQTHPGPPTIPTNLTFIFTSPSTLTVTWDIPTQLNGELGAYQIFLTNWFSQADQISRTLFVDTYTFTNIMTDVIYRIQVRAGTIGIVGDILWGPYDELWIRNGEEVSPPLMTTHSPTPIITTSPSITISMDTITTTMTSSISLASMPTTTVSILPATLSSLTTSSSNTHSISSVPFTSTTTVIQSIDMSFPISPSLFLSPFPSSFISPSPSPLPTPPSLPVNNMELSTPAIGQILVQWDAPGSGGNFDGFHIYLSPVPVDITLPITVNSSTSMITISGLANSVIYNVTIAAYNSGGDGPSVTQTIQTLVGPPSAPTNIITLTSPSDGELQLGWSPPDNPSGIIINYHILVANTGTGEQIPRSIAVPSNAQNIPFVTVFFLEEGFYSITIAAENEIGIGTPSEQIIVALFVNPPNTTTSVSTSLAITTSLTSSLGLTSSSVVFATSTSSTFTSVVSSSVSTSTVPATSLPSSTIFIPSSTMSMTLSSTTSTTLSSTASMTPSSTISMISSSVASMTPTPTIILPDPPEFGVTNLRLFATAVGQIFVNWEIPASGNYDGFHIYLDPPAPLSAGLENPIAVNSDSTFYTITGLSNGITYIVTVAPYNGGGDGPTLIESIQTLGGVPGPPTNIQILTVITDGTIHVSWSPPTNPAGTLVKYHVFVRYTDDTLVVHEEIPVSLSNQNADFNVLINVPHAQYSITLQAENENGQGMLSDSFNVSLVIATSTSVTTVSSSTSSSIPTPSSTTSITPFFMLSSFPSSPIFSTSTLLLSTASSANTPSAVFSEPTTTESVTLTDNADVSIAAIIVPTAVGIIVIFAIIIGIVLLVHYRMIRFSGRKTGIFKMSPSQAEMSYELVPAPIPIKQEPIDDIVASTPAHSSSREVSKTSELTQREAMEEPLSDESDEEQHSIVPHRLQNKSRIQQKTPKQPETIPEDEEEEIQFLGEYSVLDHQFVEVEPVEVPLDVPLVVPTHKNELDDSRKPVKPVYDPGEYSYADLDQMRAKKAAARKAKLQQSTQHHKNKDPTKRRHKSSETKQQKKEKKKSKRSSRGLINDDELDIKRDDDIY